MTKFSRSESRDDKIRVSNLFEMKTLLLSDC